VQLKREFTLRFGPAAQIKRLQRRSEMAVWHIRLSEVCRQIVPDSRSSYTEGSVTEGGPCFTDETCTSLCRAQSAWANVGDEAAVVSQVAGRLNRQRLVDRTAQISVPPIQLKRHTERALTETCIRQHVKLSITQIRWFHAL